MAAIPAVRAAAKRLKDKRIPYMVKAMRGMLTGAMATVCAMAILLSAGGCVRSLNDDSEYVMLPGGAWPYGDMLTFNLTHSDSVATGELIVAVSHDDSYRYSNLWLEISSVGRDNAVVRDTVEFLTADSTGHWLGSGITPEIELEQAVGRVSHVSGHPINVRHIMRCDTLRGVSKVGLFFKSDIDNRNDETKQ